MVIVGVVVPKESEIRVVLPSRPIEHPEFPDAVVRTPTLVAVEATDEDVYGPEHFGPIAFLVETDSTEHSLERVQATITRSGALAAGSRSSSPGAILVRRSDPAHVVEVVRGAHTNESQPVSCTDRG